MKRMKIALMAAIAIVMGTTFTSCLDSDDGPMTYPLGGVVTSGPLGGGITITAENGVRFNVTNYDGMQFSFAEDNNGDYFYPIVATIAYQQIDGKDYTEGKASYDVFFAGYYSYYFGGDDMVREEETESLTPLISLESAGVLYDHICVNFVYYHKDFAFSDFSMYPYKWENNKLYVKLVHSKTVDTSSSAKTSGMSMCFRLPTKDELQSEFPDIVFSGEDQDTIKIQLTADGPDDSELSLATSFEAKISN